MNRLLFVHNNPASFVRTDLALLGERYHVTEVYERSPYGVCLLDLIRKVNEHDLVFCWFASWHSFLPTLIARRTGRPCVVVVGGYDTANLPEARYGSQRGGLRKIIARSIMRQATWLVAFSQNARQEAIRNAAADPRKISVIYPGVEPIPMGPVEGREPLVLTVGSVWRENLLRKGLLPFVQAAAYLPDVQFIAAGRWYDDAIRVLRQAAGPNVTFTGFVPDEELRALYGRASVYVQASLHEGFGLSVAEAMLGGCIPVVTRAGALPEVVGDTGVYATSNAPADVASAIQTALTMDGQARLRARARILEQFPMERRRRELHTLIDSLI